MDDIQPRPPVDNAVKAFDLNELLNNKGVKKTFK